MNKRENDELGTIANADPAEMYRSLEQVQRDVGVVLVLCTIGIMSASEVPEYNIPWKETRRY